MTVQQPPQARSKGSASLMAGLPLAAALSAGGSESVVPWGVAAGTFRVRCFRILFPGRLCDGPGRLRALQGFASQQLPAALLTTQHQDDLQRRRPRL